MTTKVRIREVFKVKTVTNPISGYSWLEHGTTTGYEIVGPSGVVAKTRTEANAEKARKEWEAYYDKYDNA